MLFTEEVNGITYCYVPLSRKGMNYIGRRSLKVLGCTLLLVAKIALLIIKIPWFIVKIPWFIVKKLFSTCCQSRLWWRIEDLIDDFEDLIDDLRPNRGWLSLIVVVHNK